MNSRPSSTKLDALTSLRFFAALVVVIRHYGHDSGLAQLSPKLLTSGPHMVTFFFVLSGFVMMIAYHKRESVSFRDYYIARFARIAPIYYVALAGTAYFVLGYGENNHENLIIQATFLQAWFPMRSLAFNTPAWSISTEALFYAIFPVILLVLHAKQPKTITVFVISLLVWVMTQALLIDLRASANYATGLSYTQNLLLYFPMGHVCSFVVGIAAGLWYMRLDPEKRSGSKWATASLFVLLPALYWALEHPASISRIQGVIIPVVPSLLTPLFMLLVMAIATSRNLLTRILSFAPLVLLGEASYGLYILQKPVELAYRTFLKDEINTSKDNKFYIYLAILMAVSIVSLYVIEKPSRKVILALGRYLRQRKKHATQHTDVETAR